MASEKITLSEKGFGTPERGASTVLADKNGEPLTLRLVTLPDGNIGGQCVIVPLPSLRPGAKSYFNVSEEVFELKFDHKQGVGMITIRHFDCNEFIFDTYESLVCIQDNECKLVGSSGMKNSERAKSLLEGILFNAYTALIDRAFNKTPGKLFYGKPALDGGFLKLSYMPKVEKEVKA